MDHCSCVSSLNRQTSHSWDSCFPWTKAFPVCHNEIAHLQPAKFQPQNRNFDTCAYWNVLNTLPVAFRVEYLLRNLSLADLSPKNSVPSQTPWTFVWLLCWKHHTVLAVSIKWNVIVLPMAQSQGGPPKCPSPPPADAGRWWRERV